jgi:hypothetical protein
MARSAVITARNPVCLDASAAVPALFENLAINPMVTADKKGSYPLGNTANLRGCA